MMTKPIDHVRALAEKIGCRMIGTPGNSAAEEYITQAFQKAGLGVERMPFSCPAWSAEKTQLWISGRPAEAYANAFSPACLVSRPIFPLCSLEALETADLDGKVALLMGDLVRGPLAAKSFFLKPERDLRIIHLLEAKRPAAVITVNPALGTHWRVIEDMEFTIPSVTVPLEVGLALASEAGNRVQLHIPAQCTAGETAHVLAHLPGRLPWSVVVCAHYDTKVDTPGASDNAAGVAVMLALSERLALQKNRRVGIEFVAFSNEEYDPTPEENVYFKTMSAGFENIVAVLNMDGLGNVASTTTLADFSGSAAFQQRGEALRQARPGVARTEPWPASNHFMFYTHGVPCVAISAAGPGVWHTPADLFSWIDPQMLDSAVDLLADLAAELDSRDPQWSRCQDG
jgi:aminopeptidase YwaD